MVKKSPLFFYTLFYIVGIFLGNNISCSTQTLFSLTICVIVCSVLLFYLAYKKRYYKINQFLHSSIFLAFLLAGVSNMAFSPYAQKNLISSFSQKREIKELRLLVKNGTKIHRNSSSVYCHAVDYNENVIIYSKSKTTFNEISPGDMLIIDYTPIEITNSNNDFDYKKFQAKRRCFTYGYLKETNSQIVKQSNQNILASIRIKREKLITDIRDKYDGSEWCDILIALVSGDKSYLEDKTKDIYKASGAVHLMAVSGLHVGFVYFFVLNILAFLGKRGIIKYLKAVLLIAAVWLYCAFSGFSPSSARASLMISILVISELLTGRYISLNALCASALIITLIQPHSLFDIGFQLSYVALLSIIVINPYFNRRKFSNNRVVQYCWNIISISLSCQIGTSFITIGSFGYFPLYFMVSNIILMPLTALVLYGFGAIMMLGFWDSAINFISLIIKGVIDVMYKTALRVDSLPLSVIDLNSSIGTKICAYSVAFAVTAYIVYSSANIKLQGRSNE